jgi:hypothetical protein
MRGRGHVASVAVALARVVNYPRWESLDSGQTDRISEKNLIDRVS